MTTNPILQSGYIGCFSLIIFLFSNCSTVSDSQSLLNRPLKIFIFISIAGKETRT